MKNLGIYPLRLKSGFRINYEVNPENVDFPRDAPKSPKIFLINLEITSNILGVINESVLYFVFENYNFLEEIILRYKINISHFVKVR